MDQRLSLVRQIADALRYAHSRRIIYRSLSPRSILVPDPASPNPTVRLFNWQFGRPLGTGCYSQLPRQSSTILPTQIAEESSMVYFAPEALHNPRARGETMDVFSLGAIAYHIFSGQPPAESLTELNQALAANQGLLLSAALDGVTRELAQLIRESTCPEVMLRTESESDFLQGIDTFEEAFTQPPEEPVAHPHEARPGETLRGGLKVKARLCGGASALVLLVDLKGKERVLKVARNRPAASLICPALAREPEGNSLTCSEKSVGTSRSLPFPPRKKRQSPNPAQPPASLRPWMPSLPSSRRQPEATSTPPTASPLFRSHHWRFTAPASGVE